MKRFLSAFLLLIIFKSNVTAKFLNDSTAVNIFTFQGGYEFGSNSISNDLAKTYFVNGFISDPMKDVVSKKLCHTNRFGVDVTANFQFQHRTDSLFGLKNSYYKIGFSDIFHLDSKFSKDAFELFFRGNKEYAGKTADLNDFELTQLRYQQINFSYGHQFYQGHDLMEWSAGLNLNKGQQLLSIVAPLASIYTDVYGEFLDLNAKMEIHSSDSSKTKFDAFNGFGPSINMAFKWTDYKKRELKLSVENFGFINWNENSTSVSTDTSFRFEGVDVSDLFEFKDSVLQTINLDSTLVQPYLTNRNRQSYVTLLPALMKLSYTIPLENYHLRIETAIQHLAFANALPMIYQNYVYRVNRHHAVGLKVSYGGYSGFHAGINYQWNFNSWMLQLRSDQLDGFLMKNGTAQGAFVSLSKYF